MQRLDPDDVARQMIYDNALRDCLRELRVVELDHPSDLNLAEVRRRLVGLMQVRRAE